MNRIHKFDTMKGMLIFCVVFGHFLESLSPTPQPSSLINGIIYSFHMPLFMYIAGRFAKTNIIRAIYLLLIFGFCKGWFLCALGVYLLLTPLLQRVQSRKGQYCMVALSIVFALIGGFFPAPMYFTVTIRLYTFLPYFLIGYYRIADWKPNTRLKPICVAIILIAASLLFASPFIYPHLYLCSVYSNMMHFGFRILAYLLGIGWITVIPLFISDKPIPVITQLGKYTMWLYVLHLPWMHLARPIVAAHYSVQSALLASIVTIALLILPAYGCTKAEQYLFKKAIPAITAKYQRKVTKKSTP